MRLFEFRAGRCDRLAEWLIDRQKAGCRRRDGVRQEDGRRDIVCPGC